MGLIGCILYSGVGVKVIYGAYLYPISYTPYTWELRMSPICSTPLNSRRAFGCLRQKLGGAAAAAQEKDVRLITLRECLKDVLGELAVLSTSHEALAIADRLQGVGLKLPPVALAGGKAAGGGNRSSIARAEQPSAVQPVHGRPGCPAFDFRP